MTINDSNWQFLHDATGLSLTYNDMYFRYLRDQGYTGTLQDMIGASGFGMNPSGLGNPAQGNGIPQFITINDQRGQLLFGLDGLYLTGLDGAPLYGRVI